MFIGNFFICVAPGAFLGVYCSCVFNSPSVMGAVNMLIGYRFSKLIYLSGCVLSLCSCKKVFTVCIICLPICCSGCGVKAFPMCLN